LHSYQPSQKTSVYASGGEILAEFFIEKREVVPLSRIPHSLQKAFIAVEDHRFYSHPGLDIIRLAKVLWINFPTWSKAQGTSTITQQLARNLFLTQERTLSRKIREIILAIEIEKKFSKNEILEMYLNQIYFAHGIYGVAEASFFYFNKPLEKLNLAESATLASIPRSPGHYSPLYNPENTLTRRNHILQRMYEVGFISEEEMQEARKFPLAISEDEYQRERRYFYKAPYFVELVRQTVAEKYGYEMLWRGGLKIYTTLDVEMQNAAEKAILPYLKENDFQGALLAMDPHTGQILAMVGGRDFTESQFNRATQARRQAGSAFKVFTYTAAIDSKKFNAVSPFYDSPVVFVSAGQPIWSPENYERHYWGDVNLWQMLASSINVASVKLLQEVGVSNVIRYARKMGVESPLNADLTLTLGTSGVSLLEMVRGYATIANYGIKMNPMYIAKVETSRGKVLEENFPAGEKAFSSQTAFCMIDLLKKAVDMGTGRRIRWLGFDRPCAGKTGTVGWPGEKNTDKIMDSWFIGFTPELIAGVWIGKDDSSPLGDKLTGSVAAIPIWTEFMKKALEGKPVKDFSSPPGVIFKKIDLDTGYLATDASKNTEWFAFLEENAPTKYSPEEREDNKRFIREFNL
ncbi:PBP1A family penicillin-binding protein, partial [Candidatus Aerophobetes bacterium]|nr:PBP1A family penicillin-binding protein [Candidatus Aerophobetes bacterium]